MDDPVPARRGVRGPVLIAATAAIAVVAYLLSAVPPSKDSSKPTPSTPMAAASTPRSSPTPVPTPRTSEVPPTLDPQSVDRCAVDDLVMAARGWGGATGSMGGSATLINVSIDPCRIEGKPALELRSSDGTVLAQGSPAQPGDAVVLVRGGVAGVITVWSNWCHNPPARPLALQLSPFGLDGGWLATVDERDGGSNVPRCDLGSAPSAIGAPTPFEIPDREIDPSASDCAAGDLRAWLGPWGAAAGTDHANVIVWNRSGFTCSIPTSPQLDLLDAAGKTLVTAERWADPDSRLVLPAGIAALTSVGFANWCIEPPRLPLRFRAAIGDGQIDVIPSSARSRIGVPGCNSTPGTPPPNLGYDGPFARPTGIETP